MLKNRKNEWLFLTFIILGLSSAIYFLPENLDTRESLPTKAPEIEKILSLKTTKEQSVELLKLLERVGPETGQEMLFHSGLPFTGETHLLIHSVGNYIYDHFGQDGLSYCKDYFLSACYHAVILNTLGDDGLSGVKEAIIICDKAGGAIVASQCAHGAGHGFVAWHDYDLLKALKMCDQLGGELENFAYFNCYDGVFMENFWGVHGGAPSEKRWVKADDINYPCNDPAIPEKYLRGCWSNQATLAYQYFKGNLKKTAEFCDAVVNPNYREVCYNNFARQIHPLTQGSTEKVKSLCSFATGERWQDDCVLTNLSAYWSVGDRVAPYQLCESLEGELKNSCFERLSSLIRAYYEGPGEMRSYCAKIADKHYRTLCQNPS